MTNTIPWTARSASTRSFSGCGADLSELSGGLRKAQSVKQRTTTAFSGGRWGPRESWDAPTPLFLGLRISTVLCCVLKVQSKRTDSYPPRGEAWKCQLGHAETTGRLKFFTGSFPATVTLESLIEKQTNKQTTPPPPNTCHFRGGPWISDFETYPGKVAGFLFLFLFMGNECLNLNNPQCFCDLIALLGTVS